MIFQGVGPGPAGPGRFENYFYCRPRVLLFVNSNLRLQSITEIPPSAAFPRCTLHPALLVLQNRLVGLMASTQVTFAGFQRSDMQFQF